MKLTADAEQLLKNPAFQEAVKLYSERLVTQWSFANTPAEREALWFQQKALTTVVQNLTGLIQTELYNSN